MLVVCVSHTERTPIQEVKASHAASVGVPTTSSSKDKCRDDRLQQACLLGPRSGLTWWWCSGWRCCPACDLPASVCRRNWFAEQGTLPNWSNIKVCEGVHGRLEEKLVKKHPRLNCRDAAQAMNANDWNKLVDSDTSA